MTWAPVALAALLLAALAYPFVRPRLRSERKARSAHRGHVAHLYPNYDEDLRFEPRHERDIHAVSRRELESFGYRPGGETAVVPRTFRRRVAGDERLRLWTSPDVSLRPVWICDWHGLELGAPAIAVPPLARALLARSDTDPALLALRDDDARASDPREHDLHDDVLRSFCQELPTREQSGEVGVKRS